MKNDSDTALYRLFDATEEPPPDDRFVDRLSGKIARQRWARRLIHLTAAAAVTFFLAALTPWVVDLTGRMALETSIFIHHVVSFLLSPAGCLIGLGMGLFLFVRNLST